MIRAAVALSTRADTARAALEAGGGVAERLGRPADWCVAFATWEHAAHLTTLQETLAGVVETPYVVGCSAAGVLAAGREVEQGPAVAVLGVVSDRLRGTPQARVVSTATRSPGPTRTVPAVRGLFRPAIQCLSAGGPRR